MEGCQLLSDDVMAAFAKGYAATNTLDTPICATILPLLLQLVEVHIIVHRVEIH